MEMPEILETIWFRTPRYDGSAENCRIWNRHSWQLGWFDGRLWNSYSAERQFETKHVTEWIGLRLPGEQKHPIQLNGAVKTALHAVK